MSDKNETRKISVSVSEDLLRSIDQRAEQEHRSRSNMISQILREEIAKYHTKNEGKGDDTSKE